MININIVNLETSLRLKSREKHRKAKKKPTINSFLLNNLRMTIYELE